MSALTEARARRRPRPRRVFREQAESRLSGALAGGEPRGGGLPRPARLTRLPPAAGRSSPRSRTTSSARGGSSTRTCSATTTSCSPFPAAAIARLGRLRGAAVLRRRDLRRAGRAERRRGATARAAAASRRLDRRRARARRRRAATPPRRAAFTCAASSAAAPPGTRSRWEWSARSWWAPGCDSPLVMLAGPAGWSCALVLADRVSRVRTAARSEEFFLSFARGPRAALRAATRRCCR